MRRPVLRKPYFSSAAKDFTGRRQRQWSAWAILGILALGNISASAQNNLLRIPDQNEQRSLAEVFPDERIRVLFKDSFGIDERGLMLEQIIEIAKTIKPRYDPRAIEDDKKNDPEAVRSADRAFVAAATLWRKSTSSATIDALGRTSISVCWINPTEENKRGRLITKAAVESTWEHHGNVDFTYWGECRPDSKGVKIKIADIRPYSYVGIEADITNPSMELNFSFNEGTMLSCKDKVELCIWSVAVHEFGHALGFLHEQDRKNTPAWCRRLEPGKEVSPVYNAIQVTSWDRWSVMDYCFDIYSTRIQISDCDVAALHSRYGLPSAPKFIPQCRVLQ